VLAKLATQRRYTDPAYMVSIAHDIYGGKIDPAQARELAAKMRPGNSLGYAYQLLGGMGWTSIPWLRCLRQRTLIVSGDDDPLIPLVNAHLMYRLIPRARLHVFHGGHLGLVVQAGELGGVIQSFLTAA
jgi:pimeloyl-ACP methyl ester carboxylesterase